METTSISDAARRLGVLPEEVKRLIAKGKLDTTESGRVVIESIYAYSGLKPAGRQRVAEHKTKAENETKQANNKKNASGVSGVATGEKPDDTFYEAGGDGKPQTTQRGDKEAKPETEEIRASRETTNGFSYEEDAFFAMLLRGVAAHDEARTYTQEELRAAVSQAYKMGRLSVYKQMQSFQRKAVRV